MKVAIFVDWENLRKDIESIQRINADFKEKFDYSNAKQVSKLINLSSTKMNSYIESSFTQHNP